MAEIAFAIEGREHLSYHLPDEFVEQYVDRSVGWGFPAGGGNMLGEIIFVHKHSRLTPSGRKERWWEVCRRVTEGVYSTLKDYCIRNRTPWTDEHAHEDAQQMFDRMFRFLWMPPGRGVEFMGTKALDTIGSAILQNCSFISTKDMADDPAKPFVMLLEQSMLGIGVGMDTRGAGTIKVRKTRPKLFLQYDVPDTREGWCESTRLLIEEFFIEGAPSYDFSYHLLRPKGTPLKTLGGVAGGPECLWEFHEALRGRLAAYRGLPVDSRLIADMANLAGRCAVMGNKRRTAEILLGFPDDKDFINLKNWTLSENKERLAQGTGWGYVSNNTVFRDGDMRHIAEAIRISAEPGIYDLQLAQTYGRLADPPNSKNEWVLGCNPCAEQPLEPWELCTLVETYPSNHESLEDYKRTLKYAYLYGKAVTLIPTHWPECNEVMIRNRRIGCSMSGVWEFAEKHGFVELRNWCDEGYAEITRRDIQYSRWLGIRESVGKTSVKPSGTVSLEAGVTPGVHAPRARGRYLRRVRWAWTEPIVQVLQDAGYPVEPDVHEPGVTAVVTFPVIGPDVRSEPEASVWEKAHLAALLQAHWSDNMVSATFSFREDEKEQIVPLIHAMEGRLKTMSFMPLSPSTYEDEDGNVRKYEQLPYEEVSEEEFDLLFAQVKPVDSEALYLIQSLPDGDRYCDGDACEVPSRDSEVLQTS